MNADEHGSKNQARFKDKRPKAYWTQMNTDTHRFGKDKVENLMGHG
jgi:hypothetical protein